jgi:hypoxanthine phosphoribosyltransferase
LLYDQPTIRGVIARIAGEVNAYYEKLRAEEGGLDLVVICVLKGAFMFYSDLVKEIAHPHRNDFVKLRSYQGLNSTGELRVETEMRAEDYAGRSVLIVEDMHDTGHTLKKFIKLLQELGPKRIDTAVLIRRPDNPVEIDLKFCGLVCSDFIVGYGLDFD